MNLAVNARDAMPDGGVFELSTTSVASKRVSWIRSRERSRRVTMLCSSVTDSGVGMAEDHLQRIFEPYFTTKELGKGTGLGLSMVYGIVSQFQGHIRVDSEVEQGNAFLHLPPGLPRRRVRRRHSLSAAEQRVAARHRVDLGGGGRGQRPPRGLRDPAGAGISGDRGLDGTDALDVYDEMDEAPDLLLTDVVMPQMKGTDLAVLLTRKQPDLRVLFMSGYNEESVFSDWKTELDRPALLAKPFSPSSLLAEIRKLLDAELAPGAFAAKGTG